MLELEDIFLIIISPMLLANIKNPTKCEGLVKILSTVYVNKTQDTHLFLITWNCILFTVKIDLMNESFQPFLIKKTVYLLLDYY